VRYHPAREAARADIMVVDAGHHGLEKHAGELMAQAFQRELDRRASQVKCLPYQDEKEVFQIYTR
jgi:putative NIF3 family GTP cyclohydrolase 1 type 2